MDHINAENIYFTYPAETGRLSVLENLGFTAAKGEFISILGPSGCGKSTLLRLLSGFYRPDRGKISINGETQQSPSPRGQMIFQDPAQLLPWLTVEKNILFPRYRSVFSPVKRKLSQQAEQQFEEVLKNTGLSSFRHYYPAQLSGGLKQRVSLARAIFSDPQILFLDEPFVSLDAPSRFELQNLLLQLWKGGGWTVFFVTHDISEALILSDKLLVFTNGEKSARLLDNPLKSPRDHNSKTFLKEKLRLYSMIDSL